MSSTDQNTVGFRLARALVRTLTQLCIKRGLTFQSITSLIKQEYLIAAEKSLRDNGQKVTQSRLSIISGITRREIDRLRESHQEDLTSDGIGLSIAARVISLWQTDKKYCSTAGKPKTLSLDSNSGEFQQLVSSVSRDVGPATILFELERLGHVTKTSKGVQLNTTNYIPAGNNKVNEVGEILQADQSALTETAIHNLSDASPYHHLRTFYDRVRTDNIEDLRAWFLKEGHDFHLRARTEIAKHDQDASPDLSYKGDYVTVSFSSFYNVQGDKK